MTDRYTDIRAALDAAQGFGEDWFVALNSAEARALLAERDALLDQHHRDSKELRRLCAQRDAARKVSKEAGAIVAELRCEIDALREALEMMVEMVEMNGWGRDYALDVARAALAQE